MQDKSSVKEVAIGIIGGSGLYELEGLSEIQEIRLETPFGDPSDSIVAGKLHGRQVYFLPRHARGHKIAPTELNHRANLYALKQLGVGFIIAVTAVGSLKEEYQPRDIVVPDQLFDRTTRREQHSFFGNGIVAHVGFADPYSAGLRQLLIEEARRLTARNVHAGGVYVCMDGPAFSTRAESNANRQLGFDVIGMTNVAEAKLAREAEIALATLAMVTDYDCWKEDEEAVSVETVLGHVQANTALAKQIIREVIARIPRFAEWPEHESLKNAFITPKTFWPEETKQMLAPILQRYL